MRTLDDFLKDNPGSGKVIHIGKKKSAEIIARINKKMWEAHRDTVRKLRKSEEDAKNIWLD